MVVSRQNSHQTYLNKCNNPPLETVGDYCIQTYCMVHHYRFSASSSNLMINHVSKKRPTLTGESFLFGGANQI